MQASRILMAERLGYVYEPYFGKPELTALEQNNKRLIQQGGLFQQDRMIKDKRRSFVRALYHSYQGAYIRKAEGGCRANARALINPNKLKADYDEKIVSVGFEHHFKTGDVFEWLNTRTYWLIYLQETTELAYFRANIRRCNYEIEFKDDDGYHKTYASIRGPVETRIDYIQKHGISVDNPNYSVNILLPNTKENLEYFRRYAKFYINPILDGDARICWRVEATDSISTPGILEINAVEYYANKDEDNIEDGIVGDLIANPLDNVENKTDLIEGNIFIKPKVTNTYKYTGDSISSWNYDSSLPIEIISQDETTITLRWIKTISGQFDLSYGDITKTIVVESLF